MSHWKTRLRHQCFRSKEGRVQPSWEKKEEKHVHCEFTNIFHCIHMGREFQSLLPVLWAATAWWDWEGDLALGPSECWSCCFSQLSLQQYREEDDLKPRRSELGFAFLDSWNTDLLSKAWSARKDKIQYHFSYQQQTHQICTENYHLFNF